MLDTAFYLVTEAIARRAGLVGSRYVTQDGRYILDNKDLSRVRLTTDEYISGLQGVERISAETAKTLIARGSYTMQAASETAPSEEETQEEEGE